MEKIISDKELRELNRIEGEGRGIIFKPELKYILEEKGEDGLKELEDTMESFGFPLKYKEIKSMDFYPLKTKALMLLAIKRLFKYEDEKFQEMGRIAAKFPSILRMIFARFIFSPERLIKETPRVWKSYITVGDAKTIKFDKKEKCQVLKIENFHFHPLECQFFIGYFTELLQIIVNEKVKCKETKCVHRGDDFHEFFLTW